MRLTRNRPTGFSSYHYLKLIEETAEIGTWSCNLAEGVDVWSPGLYRMLGLSPQDVKPSFAVFADLIHPIDRQLLPDIAQSLRDMLLIDHECRILRADGSLRWLHFRFETIHGDVGAPLRAAGVFVDQTERREAERARILWEQRYRANAERQAEPSCRAALPENIGGALFRAARGLVNWSIPELARASGVSESTIRRVESRRRDSAVRRGTISALVAALSAEGVEFCADPSGRPGIRLVHDTWQSPRP
ncbi:PAS domain-containing protein [Stappia sp. F7233]|uniref:histidine kinase n=1 Tax=Stappia albiluteola TaxID=2758565 RepID=A0A839AHK2_9HYPH|nr:PAS domain-containing protein [Stappia albiluteola]MBA5779330.1 PAS domain-containing protein [Stappia albiluteola]